jgi:tight adherence protein B
MTRVLPALACVALAAAVAALPASPGATRLGRLVRRPDATTPAHGPAAAALVAAGTLAGLLALGPVGAVVGGAAAAAWRRGRVRRQEDRSALSTANELADALGRIADELRAGAHPADALAGTDADGPLARAVLAPAATAAALGDSVPAALAAQAARHPGVARDLRRVAQTWALADRHGVPPADLLASVLADIRWRVTQAARVRAQLAGPRATAAVLTALPGLGIVLGELVGAGPLAVLRSGVSGQLLVAVGVGLAAAGATWSERILRAAVPR